MNKFKVTTIAFAVLLSSCGHSGAGNSTAANELHFAIQGDPKSFDPLQQAESIGELVRYITGGVLVRVNRATDVVEPMLAESWKLEDGSKGVVFKLRPGLKFSDGTPLNASDVERTLHRALDPKEASPIGDSFRGATGMPEIQVLSNLEIAIRYPSAKPGLERIFDQLAIIPPGENTSQSAPTAGPYFISEYKPGSYVRLKRNPNFSPLAKIPTIQMDVQANREIEMSRFLKGELLLVHKAEPEGFEHLKATNPSGAQNLGASLDSEFLWFNQAPVTTLPAWKLKWFRSVHFRHAISSSIHRDDIVRIVFKGYAQPAAGPFSPANDFWFNHSLSPRKFDSAAANIELKAGGFVFRDGTLYDSDGHAVEFSLITNSETRGRVAAVIQDDLKQMGIRVNITTLEFRSLVQRIGKTLDYEACLLGFANIAPDPMEQNNVWLSSGPQHAWWPQQKTPATAWEAEIDKAMLAQSAAGDRQERKKYFDRVQQIASEQEPIIYLVNPNFLAAISPRIHGMQPVRLTPQLVWNIERLSLE